MRAEEIVRVGLGAVDDRRAGVGHSLDSPFLDPDALAGRIRAHRTNPVVDRSCPSRSRQEASTLSHGERVARAVDDLADADNPVPEEQTVTFLGKVSDV